MNKQYEITCVFCGSKHTLNLDDEKVARWRGGELIQNVFPELSADERELMISQVCPKCTAKMFGEEDE